MKLSAFAENTSRAHKAAVKLTIRRTSCMPDNGSTDYYELLQISPNAEIETIQRVYKLLACPLPPR